MAKIQSDNFLFLDKLKFYSFNKKYSHINNVKANFFILKFILTRL